jgi:hypothetical protein
MFALSCRYSRSFRICEDIYRLNVKGKIEAVNSIGKCRVDVIDIIPEPDVQCPGFICAIGHQTKCRAVTAGIKIKIK